MKRRALATAAASAWLALSCNQAPSSKPVQRSDSPPSEPKPSALAESALGKAVLTQALASVSAKLSPDANTLAIELSPERAKFQVESPAHPGQIEEYEWRAGELHGPVALELRGRGALAQNLFALSQVDLASVPAVIELAKARIDPEQGVATRVLIRKNLPQDDSVGMRVYVESPIRSSHFDADARGRPVEPGKYP